MLPKRNTSVSFSSEEVTKALNDVMAEEGSAFDNIRLEFLIHCGKYARNRLAKLFTDMLTNCVPPEFRTIDSNSNIETR